MQRFNITGAEECIPRDNLIYTCVSSAVDLYLGIFSAAMVLSTLLNGSMSIFWQPIWRKIQIYVYVKFNIVCACVLPMLVNHVIQGLMIRLSVLGFYVKLYWRRQSNGVATIHHTVYSHPFQLAGSVGTVHSHWIQNYAIGSWERWTYIFQARFTHWYLEQFLWNWS